MFRVSTATRRLPSQANVARRAPPPLPNRNGLHLPGLDHAEPLAAPVEHPDPPEIVRDAGRQRTEVTGRRTGFSTTACFEPDRATRRQGEAQAIGRREDGQRLLHGPAADDRPAGVELDDEPTFALRDQGPGRPHRGHGGRSRARGDTQRLRGLDARLERVHRDIAERPRARGEPVVERPTVERLLKSRSRACEVGPAQPHAPDRCGGARGCFAVRRVDPQPLIRIPGAT